MAWVAPVLRRDDADLPSSAFTEYPMDANFFGFCGKLGVMAFRSYDPEPIEPLFEAHFDSLRRYAARRVGADVASDVASETFERALRSFDRFDASRDAVPWLYGIATNLIRHHARAESRRLDAYSRWAAGEVESEQDTADGASMTAGLVGGLRALSRGDREALLLFVWADLSYRAGGRGVGDPGGDGALQDQPCAGRVAHPHGDETLEWTVGSRDSRGGAAWTSLIFFGGWESRSRRWTPKLGRVPGSDCTATPIHRVKKAPRRTGGRRTRKGPRVGGCGSVNTGW